MNQISPHPHAHHIGTVLTILLAVLIPVSLSASDPAATPSPEQLEFFEKSIRPIFANHCDRCHGQGGKGGLSVSSRTSLLKGGDSGPAIIPGNAQDSLLISAVEYKSYEMPPDGRLADSEIADLKKWIEMGAPDPRLQSIVVSPIDAMMEEARSHWAFQPIRAPAVPKVPGAKTEIDAFLLAAMPEGQRRFSPSVEKVQLARRAAIDLTGLLPSEDILQKYLKSNKENAFDDLVESLLSSPHYGERWARHCLDVARYADSKGLQGESLLNGNPHAFTYRDYVIRSFNQDLPFDRFLTEQLAADLLPISKEDNRQLAALGYMTIGVRHSAYGIDDNAIDDRIDVITRGMLAMTVSCARCHDHKLEPVYSRDYYSLYAILRSCNEPAMAPKVIPQPESDGRKQWHLENIQVRGEYKRLFAEGVVHALREIRSQIGSYLLAAHDAKRQSLTDEKAVQVKLLEPRKLQADVYQSLVKNWENEIVQVPRIFGPWIEYSQLSPDGFAERSTILAKKFSGLSDAELHPLVAKMFEGEAPQSLSEVADRYNSMFSSMLDRWHDRTIENIQVVKVLSAEELELPQLHRGMPDLQSLTGKEAMDRMAELVWPDAVDQELNQVLSRKDSFTWPSDARRFEALFFGRPWRKQILEQGKKVESHDLHFDAPWRMMVLEEGRPVEGRVFVRGNPKQPGAAAPRQFLSVLQTGNQKAFPEDQSGRLEYARSIASAENPLTARVIVNRVWAWHFGQGIVSSTSDFGFQGQKPSHPELLDYLVSRFIEDGWSIKQLHRHIMRTQAYQQSSASRAVMAGHDPENRLLWRFSPRPVEVEVLRDTLLQISGQLDNTQGGRSYDFSDPANSRRTIYANLDRRNVPEFLRQFNFPNPSLTADHRSDAIQPAQGLFLLNNPLVAQACSRIAESITTKLPDGKLPVPRIRMLYRMVFQREPNSQELALATDFVSRYPESPVVIPEMYDWAIGYTRWKRNQQKVDDIHPLSDFNSGTHPQFSNARITSAGGLVPPGTAIVRRWSADQQGHIQIRGELAHVSASSPGQSTSAEDPGVTGLIVSSREGPIGVWSACGGTVATNVTEVTVQAGDHIDFIVSAINADKPQEFAWNPTLLMPNRHMAGMEGMAMRWTMSKAFTAHENCPTPMGPWEELTQVLLMSNEFLTLE